MASALRLTACFTVESAADAAAGLAAAAADVDAALGAAPDAPGAPWRREARVAGVDVHSAAVRGASPRFLRAGRRLLRAAVPVARGADEFYRLLISKEGYTLLDPDANPDDFDRPLVPAFEWAGHEGKAQLEYAHLAMPGLLRDRDYVILNAFDARSRTFY
jgi:hypothetical protein